MPENKIFAVHAFELLKSEKNVLTACPDETRKICLVFSNCVAGRWAKGSRPVKIAASSRISTAPCQFRICHVTSDQLKNRGGGILRMEVALEWHRFSLWPDLLNTDVRGQQPEGKDS